MKTRFRKSFTRDLKKLKSRTLLDRVRQIIGHVEDATDPGAISDLKKLSGATHAYRIRVGEYRIEIIIEGDTVEFIRLLPRGDLYRFFP